MGVGRIFSREGSIGDFPGEVKKTFAGRPKMAKFPFSPLETKKTFLSVFF